ncbi:MAG TPA: DUF5320 family protein [bacterium]|nr:DUF5320 family protein [bacterium]
MPRGDKTGPNGQGMMTGRKKGYCAGHNVEGTVNGLGGGLGGGFGRGFGRGLGRGKRFLNTNPVETEELKAKIDQLTKRLEELEKK